MCQWAERRTDSEKNNVHWNANMTHQDAGWRHQELGYNPEAQERRMWKGTHSYCSTNTLHQAAAQLNGRCCVHGSKDSHSWSTERVHANLGIDRAVYGFPKDVQRPVRKEGNRGRIRATLPSRVHLCLMICFRKAPQEQNKLRVLVGCPKGR